MVTILNTSLSSVEGRGEEVIAASRTVAMRFHVRSTAPPMTQDAVLIADAMRYATLSRLANTRSQVLSGRADDGAYRESDHVHAHYLAFASDSANSRIDTVAVWAPMGLSEPEVHALAQLTWLGGRTFNKEFERCRLDCERSGSVAYALPELVGPARSWASVTPYAPPRNRRKNETWQQHVEKHLRRDLIKAGYSTAVLSIEVMESGWSAFRRHRIQENAVQARRAAGLNVVFAEPVVGPLCFGALRHFGLGLFRPVTDGDALQFATRLDRIKHFA